MVCVSWESRISTVSVIAKYFYSVTHWITPSFIIKSFPFVPITMHMVLWIVTSRSNISLLISGMYSMASSSSAKIDRGYQVDFHLCKNYHQKYSILSYIFQGYFPKKNRNKSYGGKIPLPRKKVHHHCSPWPIGASEPLGVNQWILYVILYNIWNSFS